ncbi:MAG: response regulator transcription factor [Chloroflexota bacterium]|nr:response regulator transcription factor [Chloroflexota bacterium]
MKVVIIYPNTASAHGLALLLEKYGDFEVVAEVSGPEEAMPALSLHEPSLILLNSHLSELPLEDSISQLKESSPETAVVVVTETEDWQPLELSIRAGASAFVSMNTAPEELALCLRLAADGHVLVSTSLVSSLSDLVEGETETGQSDTGDDLSRRELEILEHVARGATNQEIGDALTITENTVKVHMRNVLGKLQPRNRQQAAAYALKSGIVSDFDFLGQNQDEATSAGRNGYLNA